MDRELTTLDDVMDAFLAEAPSPDHATLLEWVTRYPQFRRELLEAAASWALSDALEEAPESGDEAVEDETLFLRGMSLVQNRLYARAAEQGGSSLGGILSEAKRLRLPPKELADHLEVGAATLKKLDLRMIRPGSIPRIIIHRLAQALKTSTSAVAEYLQQPMALPQAAQYRSESAPSLPAEQEDFFEAVGHDQALDEATRKRWLDLLSHSP